MARFGLSDEVVGDIDLGDAKAGSLEHEVLRAAPVRQAHALWRRGLVARGVAYHRPGKRREEPQGSRNFLVPPLEAKVIQTDRSTELCRANWEAANMESNAAAVGADTPELPNGIAIEIESDATLGYASIQNSVPVVRSLRLTNHGIKPVENLQVLITCSPQFAQGIKLRFDRLGPSETRRISPIDLHPDHTFLVELQESVNAAVKVPVRARWPRSACGGRPLRSRGRSSSLSYPRRPART